MPAATRRRCEVERKFSVEAISPKGLAAEDFLPSALSGARAAGPSLLKGGGLDSS